MSPVTTSPTLETRNSRRALLAASLRQVAQQGAAHPLSFAQQRLWFLDQLEPESPLYNLCSLVRIQGRLQTVALERALGSVVQRHEVLRSKFATTDDGPVQKVEPEARVAFETVDLQDRPATDREPEARRLIAREVARPFDLKTELPLRALLVQVGPAEHLLLLNLHHIASDEWSLRVLYRELFAFYEAYVQGTAAALPELPIQYSDFAAWQKKWLAGPVLGGLVEFWKAHLAGNPPVTEIPADRPRPARPTFKGGTRSITVAPAIACGLKQLAAQEKVTSFMLLLAAFEVLLNRITQQDDLVVGTPIAGRTRRETEGLIGFFVNTLPLRVKIAGEPSFREFLGQVRKLTLAAYEHQDLPFEKIVEALQPERSLNHMPFTRVMFVLQNAAEEVSAGGLRLEHLEVEAETAKFDLTLRAQEGNGSLRLSCEYSADLFERETVDRLLHHFEVLLEGIVAEPGRPISRLPLLSAADYQHIVLDWNDTRTDYPRETPVSRLFEEQAAATPDAVAAVFGSRTLTYGELNERANQLAWHLKSTGVGVGQPVALSMRRSPEVVVAMLAILKAGGAYVPLDPMYPRDRVELMLKDSGATLVLTQQSLLSSLPTTRLQTLCLDADWDLVAGCLRQNPPATVTGDDLAYIMYTSGSTGVPKGVAVTHRGITRLVRATNYIQFDATDRVAQVSNISFDAATFEIWGALLNGGRLVGITRDVSLSPKDFAEELREQGITAMFLTSALFSQVAAEAPEAFATLRTLIAGGDALDPKAVRAVLNSPTPPQRLLNGYGPTENTTFTACHWIREVPESATSVPIGRPISNTQVYILDRHLNPMPVGVPGELYAGGDGLARGYLNRQELTQERFITNPLKGLGAPSDRLYRTGDLARYLPDGSIEFLGRIDGQVKVRGFRIEMGEIETLLRQHPAVRDCVLTVTGATASSRKLFAYVVPRPGENPNASQLRAFLLQKLPEYMLPSGFVQIASLPLSPNGKVDRAALPAPDAGRPELEKKYAPPRDDVEKRLAQIWEQVLGVEPVGVEDRFFDLGGHSLLAVKVIAKVQKQFGRKLRLATIFQAPTVAQIAAILRGDAREPGTAGSSSLVELHTEGKGPPLFLVHGAGGGMFWGYLNLARHLNQPVYSFKSRGLDGLPEFESIEEMARQYIADMRRLQPRGPYHLGGYCFGGNVAFEMARQLEAAGEQVALLALMNCAPPNSRYTRIPWTPQWGFKLGKNLVYWMNYFRSWTTSQRSEFFKWKWGVLRRKAGALSGLGKGEAAQVDVRNIVDLSSYSPEQQRVWEAHIRALVRYRPGPYQGRVHLFRSPGHPLWCSFDDDYGWGDLAQGGVTVSVVPGAHEKILDEPCVERLSGELSSALASPPKPVIRSADEVGRMALCRGVMIRASLFWLGADGGLVEVVAPAVESGGFTLATLFQHIGIIGAVGAAPLGSREETEKEENAKSEEAPPKRPERMEESRALSENTARKLEKTAADLRIPLSAVLLAAAKVLFFRYSTGDAELRPAKSLDLSTDGSAVRITCQINEAVLKTELTQGLKFDQVAKALGERVKAHVRPKGSKRETAQGPIHLLAVRLQSGSGESENALPDLDFSFECGLRRVVVRVGFNPAFFDEAAARSLLDHFTALLEGIARNPKESIAVLPLLSDEGRRRVLVDWNHTDANFGLNTSYVTHFRAQAAKTPHCIAAIHERTEMTYAELDRRSNAFAAYLQSVGVGTETVVGVCLDRSLELLVTLLGVWKAGGAYVPLDPDYPPERLAFMLRDSRVAAVVTRQRFLKHLGDAGAAKVICLDAPEHANLATAEQEVPPACTADGNSLAYVIYTSGSTGTPKGVQITHRSLLNHNLAMAATFELTEHDRVMQFTPISFDISVEEIFPTLIRGAAVVFRSDEVLASPDRFLDFVEQKRITILNLPTAYWHELVETIQRRPAPPSLRLVVIGGEKASDAAFQRWRTAVHGKIGLINTYGPTETTVTSTLFKPGPSDETLPIGKPIANVHIVLLDERQQPVPVGVTGELFIGGEGLARGYLNRPDLTAEKFVSNPIYPEIPSRRLYRTGDLARYRPDGQLEFVGRVDHQVKFRGFRIELGEIEAALRAHPGVKEAAVLVRQDEPGQKRLVAYFVSRDGKVPRRELRKFLGEKLPEYMVPQVFVNIDEFPLTPAGKIDRRALPKPGNYRPELEQPYTAPRTPLEQVMAGIWAEVLRMDKVGVFDNWFDLGGHSLLAVQVMARLRDALQMDLSLASLFEQPTVAALAERLIADGNPVLSFGPLLQQAPAELTAHQQRVWFLDQFDPRQSPYNNVLGFELKGSLDRLALEKALSHTAERHPWLRSIFPIEAGRPVRYTWPAGEIALLWHDLSGTENAPEKARELARQEARRSYVLVAPVFRPVLFRMAADEHWLILVLHELGGDNLSLRTVAEEVFQSYRSLIETGALHPHRAGHAEIEVPQPAPAEASEALDYWRRHLAAPPDALDLPTDRSRPAQREDAGARVRFSVGRDQAEALGKLCAEHSVSEEAVMLAAYQALLFRHTGASDLVVGTEASVRPAGKQNAVGPFANEIALRARLEHGTPFAELARQAAQALADGRKHGRLPFADILRELHVARDASRTPLFQAAFRFDGEPLRLSAPGSLQIQRVQLGNATSRVDLALQLSRTIEGYEGAFEYSTSLFDAGRMERLATHWQMLLAGALRNPAAGVGALPLLTEEEERKVLDEWNSGEQPVPAGATLSSLFSEQVRKTPAATALVSGTTRFSYEELHGRANRVSEWLRSQGMGSGTLVAICLERSWEMVAAILGTLQAGAAYVPLDPAYPRDRISAVLADAQAAVLITQKKWLGTLAPGDARVLCVDEFPWDPSDSAEAQVENQLERAAPAPDSLAYVIYTSGSTGVPKGVAIEHRNAVALVCWATTAFPREDLEGVLASTSVCFDLSIFEMFVPLACGGKVILAENALAFPDLPAAREVTLVNTVPSVCAELLRAKGIPASVRVINLAGEPLSRELVEQIYANTSVQRVYDLYGPTETTTYSTYTLRERATPASIGRPLPGEQTYVLDARRQPVPIGVPGELYISGVGVARGYLNRPELTAERFVENQFRPGTRMYRTGDLVRWNARGCLEYLGRLDHQVKIRGFRIELGEIEATLRRCPEVKETVVVARPANSGEKRLVAYVVAAPRSEVDAEQLKRTLRSTLPEHMVPATFVFLKALPLTPNGKVDRKALPEPEFKETPARSYVAPRTAAEQSVAEVFQDVLGIGKVGATDDFFELGGHSLLAVRAIARLRDLFQVSLPLMSLFQAPTPEKLADLLASDNATGVTRSAPPAIERANRGEPLPVSFVQERLWFLDQLLPDSDAYNVPSALRLRGRLNLPALQSAYAQVVSRHEALRTRFGYHEGVLVQRLDAPLADSIAVREINAPASDVEAELRKWIETEAQRPFDLAAGPLVRTGLAQVAETEHVLLVVMHHSISDGWSMAVFFQELARAYEAILDGRRVELPPLPAQYADFACWQRRWMQGPVLQQELDYWKHDLAGAPPVIDLPADHPSSQEANSPAGREVLRIEPELWKEALQFSQKQGVTPFMLLLTALGVVLHKWTGQRDMVVGTVVAGRGRREVENVIGCFMNFLPLRLRITAPKTGRELLAETRRMVLEAQSHQDCPFEKIVEVINPERKRDQNPLYNVALLFQNFPQELFKAAQVESSPYPVTLRAPLLDLRFEAETAGEALEITCEYKANLFEAETIEALSGSLRGVLEGLVRQPDAQFQTAAVSPALLAQAQAARSRSERQDLCLAANFTAEPIEDPLRFWFRELEIPVGIDFAPYNQVFQQLVDPQSQFAANRRGLNVILLRLQDWRRAKQDHDGNNEAALDETLQRSANEFIELMKAAAARLAVPTLVVFCPASPAAQSDPALATALTQLEKSLVEALLPVPGVYPVSSGQVLKYYPVDGYADTAAEQLGHVPYTPKFFSALATMVARKFHALKRAGYKVIALDCDNTLWTGVCGEDGPKGIRLDPVRLRLQEFMLEQHQAGRLICLCSKNNPEDVEEVFAQRADMPLKREHITAVQLNWNAKSQGLVALARQLNLGLDSFIFIDDNPVECAEVEANCPEVLTLLLPEDTAKIPSFLDHCWALDHLKVTAEDRKRAEMYRQNQAREALRAGATTLADFIAGLDLKIRIEPLKPEQIERVAQLTQRTNQFNFTTRRRNEAEIEALRQTARIDTVTVTDRFGDYGLVGVIIWKPASEALDVDTFLLSCRVLGRGVEHRMLAHLGDAARKAHLKWVDVHYLKSAKNKPAADFLEAMGAHFKQGQNGGLLYRFPAGYASEVAYTPQPIEVSAPSNGDGNRPETSAARTPLKQFRNCRAIALELASVDAIHSRVSGAERSRQNHSTTYAAPRTELETKLCELWQSLLKLDRVGISDNFFDLGGHSLLAVRLFAEIERMTGSKLPLVTLFQAPTIQALAAILAPGKGNSKSLLVPIQPNGTKPPLFLVHGAGGDVLWGYANLAAHLGEDQPIYGIKSRGQLGLEECATMEEMARCYVKEVRAFQPSGPYYLGGYCFGGNVAYEMARQMEAEGHDVALVALMDSAPSNAGYESVRWWRPTFPFRFARNLSYWLDDFRRLEPGARRRFVTRKAAAWGRKVKSMLGFESRPATEVDLDEVIDVNHFPEHELKLWQAHLQALVTHTEKPYSGPVTLLRTRGQPVFCSLEPDFCWRSLAPKLAVKLVPGSHEEIFMEPHVRTLANELRASLATAAPLKQNTTPATTISTIAPV